MRIVKFATDLGHVLGFNEARQVIETTINREPYEQVNEITE